MDESRIFLLLCPRRVPVPCALSRMSVSNCLPRFFRLRFVLFFRLLLGLLLACRRRLKDTRRDYFSNDGRRHRLQQRRGPIRCILKGVTFTRPLSFRGKSTFHTRVIYVYLVVGILRYKAVGGREKYIKT